jgi:hypothetical protein
MNCMKIQLYPSPSSMEHLKEELLETPHEYRHKLFDVAWINALLRHVQPRPQGGTSGAGAAQHPTVLKRQPELQLCATSIRREEDDGIPERERTPG